MVAPSPINSGREPSPRTVTLLILVALGTMVAAASALRGPGHTDVSGVNSPGIVAVPGAHAADDPSRDVHSSDAHSADVANLETPSHEEKADPNVLPLFDGETLEGWSITEFGGEGDVWVEEGQLMLGVGAYLTGVTTTRDLPKINYEVSLDAMRVDGSDFFVGLTFPVKDDPCTLILGGWGGGVCGLSSINGFDASENETTSYREFQNGRWYAVRLRVTDEKIEAWVDDEQIVDQSLEDVELSIRVEVDPSQPFGFATYATTGALKNVRLKKLPSPPAGDSNESSGSETEPASQTSDSE